MCRPSWVKQTHQIGYEGNKAEDMFDALYGRSLVGNIELDREAREQLGVKGKKYSGTYKFKVLPIWGAAFRVQRSQRRWVR